MSAALLVVVLAVAGADWQSSSQPSPTERWVELVRQHEPGALDDAVFELAAWSAEDLQAALNGLAAYGRWRFDRQAAEAMNDLLKRAALLHTDLAVLAPERARRFRALPAWEPEVAVQARDGQPVGSRVLSGHWRLARSLLERVNPNPARDETVRIWHHAVAAYLIAQREFAVAQRHLEGARRLLRGDAQIAFFSGVLHETFASPGLQEAARSARRTSIQSRRIELDSAARYFRSAVRADPAQAEARLRLGRVLLQQGRPAEALPELEAALAASREPRVMYFGQMFLGAAQQALGRRAAARSAYERAAALEPEAQAPLVALGHLARESGDRGGAVRLVERLARLPSIPEERYDPMWDYDAAPGWVADELFAALRAPFMDGSEP